MTLAGLLVGPDPVAIWLRLERLTRHVIGRRMEEGATPETDEPLDRLIALRKWLARRWSS